MAALTRPTEATYAIHEEVTVDTSDHEDHTFCGIMFPVKCKELLPLDHVVIHSVAVRGRLGPLTVWVSNEEQTSERREFRMKKQFWTKIYEQTHGPSLRDYVTLDFSNNPIRLNPGEIKAIYIHSTLRGDEAIVYDNRHSRLTHSDALVSILSGRAHVSETPFGTRPIWGWGNPWRDQREFVGQLQYGAVYRLWNPHLARIFGSRFQSLTRALFLCQRRWESPFSLLPDECIFYILNMCRWDWANDTPQDMKALRRRRLARERQEREQSAEQAAAAAEVSAVAGLPAVQAEEEPPSPGCCRRLQASQDDQAEDEGEDDPMDREYHPADEEEEEEEGVEEEEEEVDFDEDMDEEEDSDEDSEDDEWEEDGWNGYGARSNIFMYEDEDSDTEPVRSNEAANEGGRRAWIHRHFARFQILQALGAADDDDGDDE